MQCGNTTVQHPRRLPLTIVLRLREELPVIFYAPQKLQLELTDNDCVFGMEKEEEEGLGGR